ncbi:uncharacterized protein I303_108588 [Kwoniella dejecticola CBS 10117]|uniref:STEEP1 domain-containing protein n=1 Tax=Kwoniella dejecticola CBS 10117 TaxID=1296121 RepID=A0A1A5ZWZ7_9TREE|nr:uncharacterized protein I303_07087 [Kwoniella dejecticola CBS 10117]OBR82328.1 hypothetical protein I303_07087 [Kwoniella dejecticola CBS 10117]
MPKVFSRAVTSSSEQAGQTQSSRAVLRSYYCLCGDFVLVLQGKLDRLPRRKTDGSYIIRSKDGEDPIKQPARKFKLNATPGQRCLIKKKGGQELEIRQPFVCSRCNTTIAYQSTLPPAGDGPFLYILKGSMTELQGRLPPDAFEGEEDLQPSEAIRTEIAA